MEEEAEDDDEPGPSGYIDRATVPEPEAEPEYKNGTYLLCCKNIHFAISNNGKFI